MTMIELLNSQDAQAEAEISGPSEALITIAEGDHWLTMTADFEVRVEDDPGSYWQPPTYEVEVIVAKIRAVKYDDAPAALTKNWELKLNSVIAEAIDLALEDMGPYEPDPTDVEFDCE
jgi:hypothetical protein